jgi:DNA-binding IclR family transcriptional regulator
VNPEDAFVTAISRWLAGHLDDRELEAELAARPDDGLSPDQREALGELLDELGRSDRSRGQLQMVARETLEALALGG